MIDKNILVTGGAGYIGSHVCVELLNSGYHVTVVDNLVNSSEESIKRVEKITSKKINFHKIDLLDQIALENIFKNESFQSVIHFAGLKAVGESVQKPMLYYKNNLIGSLNLLETMQKYGVKNMVFSSSACVYGDPDKVPITENFPVKPTNPYGQTKAMIEQILKDMSVADTDFQTIVLRYFNPIGAHTSGLIGEDPNGIPNNLVPYVAQVAVGKIDSLKVYGNDYETVDGTGVRDYIHISDLANAHLKALKKLEERTGYKVYNIGTGRGHSVLEVISAFEKASGKKVPYEIVDRRPGDTATVYSSTELANKDLNWTAVKTIDEMCEDSWRWQSNNPKGYLA